MNFEKAKDYILGRLRNELDPYLFYHSYEHTLDVYEATINLATMEGVEGENLELVKLAALYHDAGFIYQYLDNEKVAAIIVREVLPQFGYNKNQIEKVANMILATVVFAIPKNHLEEIVKDADLDYLGRDDFNPISTQLHKELNSNGFQLTEKNWDEIQVRFFDKHLYYTKSANMLRLETKQKHFTEIKNRLMQQEK